MKGGRFQRVKWYLHDYFACLKDWSFNYVGISGAVTNAKIINVERTLHARGKIFNDTVNLKRKQSNNFA